LIIRASREEGRVPKCFESRAGDGILSGLRVIDLSSGRAGPMVAMVLADHGADVVKIEPPGGDPARAQLGYRVWQRGKRSAVLDLSLAADREDLGALVRHADVLIESFEAEERAGLGLGLDALAEQNPRLVHCSITAYGDDPEHRGRPGIDALVAARTGLHWEQRGWPEGAIRHMARLPDRYEGLEHDWENVQGAPRPGPLFPASQWPSMGAFYLALLGVSAALRAREITGRGQHVATSLLQGAIACGWGVWQRAERTEAPLFDSWILGSRSPKGHFRCKDGRWIHNWVPNPRFLLEASRGAALEASRDLEARKDPDRFGTGHGELVVMLHYQPQLAKAAQRFAADEWTQAAARAGMTIQPVRSPEEALADPLFLADGCVVEIDDPELGPIRMAGVPYQLDASPGRIRSAAPRAGQHTAEVRAEAARLRAAPAPAPGTGRPLAHPLAGITVLDLGLAIAGPYGTQLLSDLGATVIKVNALHDGYWHSNHIAYTANRGKQSIALDLKHPKGMQVLRELVARADVVQHNMRYEAAERLGVDDLHLRELNPRLIYCHTRGFETGPRELLPGNDQTGACLAGVQWEDGAVGRGGKPLWSLTSLGDTGNGFLSAIAILQALAHRDRTGEGQYCTTSIVNAQLLVSSTAVARPDGTGFERPRIDAMQYGFSALHRLYECADGWLCVVAIVPAHAQALCRALGVERADDDDVLAARLAERFRTRSASAWFAALDAAGVPVEVCDPGFALRLHDHPESHKRGYSVTYEHPFVGRLDQAGLLVSLSDTPGVVQGPPVIVGQHTRTLMRELGYSDAQIDAAITERWAAEWVPGSGNPVA
jgi:crotonobetainyl-CoA:carnitine CoA-transferase CaiB-like acyl-CoA transferase